MRADRLLILAALAAALALRDAPRADACGPDFPVELLSGRDAVMAELPEGVFLDEVTTLVPRDRACDPDPTLTASDRELILYDRGAQAWHAGDRERARAQFLALLALPADQRRARSTWAAYMLGRIDPASLGEIYFPMVRALVEDGYSDEQHLAAASFGEQALLHEGVDKVRLYAQQAACGDPSGGTSLLFVVRQLVADAAEATILVAPLGQRLLAIYLYTRSAELTQPQADRLWSALAALPHPAGADRLAAAAYRRGDWDRAQALVARAPDTAISRWVRAKLALRAGDRAAAARYLDATAAAYDLPHDTLDSYVDPSAFASRQRVDGERALLALADRRPLDAMAAAWAARATFRDAIYVAERVLTVDELRTFVDALPSDDDSSSGDWGAFDLPQLRALLGRRLMRAGRFADAVPYLPRTHRGAALGYAAALTASHRGDPIDQARALFDASTIARLDGLELLGTEHAPDWATYGASYDLGPDVAPLGPWRGPDERARWKSSAPAFSQRYHYRYLASQLAERAADHLPHQSQAYAATLCWSARYVFNDDPARVQRLYHRYLRTGPAAVSMDFGQTCPEPSFSRARRYLPPARPRWPIALPIAAFLITATSLFASHRRRRFAARP